MKDADPPPRKTEPHAAPFDAFKELAAKLFQVPKKEVDKTEKAYQRERKKHPKRGPKPSEN